MDHSLHHGHAPSSDGSNLAASVDAFLSSLDESTQAAHDHHAHHQGMDHSAHAGHMMKMWFHGGCEEVILFDFWRTESCMGIFWSCIAIFIMGAAYEGLKWFRVYMQLKQAANGKIQKEPAVQLSEIEKAPLQHKHCSQEDVYNPTTTPPSRRVTLSRSSPFCSSGAFSVDRILEAVLYITQLVLAYWLMLIVMTYNTYLTAAVILGAGFGHWLFAVLKLNSPLGETADSFATDACH
ncbi:unnamed protein product [Auanema sp. JU1783]|nr:unnamed protein product [Auanema sp. JU1783]